MKYLIYILTICPLLCFGQIDKQLQRQAAVTFVSGMAFGVHELANDKPHKIQAAFPSADMQWWDKSVSWQNKWRNGDPNQGERFFGSSTAFVGVTDADHCFGQIHTIGLTYTAVGFTRNPNNKRTSRDLFLRFVFLNLIRVGGMYMTWATFDLIDTHLR
jgi:hypothetical protein